MKRFLLVEKYIKTEDYNADIAMAYKQQEAQLKMIESINKRIQPLVIFLYGIGVYII